MSCTLEFIHTQSNWWETIWQTINLAKIHFSSNHTERTLLPADDSWALEGDPDDGEATDEGGGGGGIGRDTG